jgi:Calcineurin-like phosphoesterase
VNSYMKKRVFSAVAAIFVIGTFTHACSGHQSAPLVPAVATPSGLASVRATISPNPLPAAPDGLGGPAHYSVSADVTYRETAGMAGHITRVTFTIIRSPSGTATSTVLSRDMSVPPNGSATESYATTFDEGSDTGAVWRLTASGDSNGTAFDVPQAEAPIQIAGGPLQPGAVQAVLIGAGDIASCENDNDEATARLLDQMSGTVFNAGDNVYDDGATQQYGDCYEPTWGRHKGRTRPSPGNHEYHTSNASGYFTYFGAAAGPGYYSYDLGGWHVMSLNSNIPASPGSPQYEWLRNDLDSNRVACSAAYWHHPVFSSGDHGNSSHMQAIWQLLYEHGVDVIINGHDHDYERFAPQDPDGRPDPARGIREFVVGTGGKGLRSFKSIRANSEVRDSNTYGVIRLSLRTNGYDWEFVPAAGGSFSDAGTGTCSPAR